MNIKELVKAHDFKGRDYPLLVGHVKLKLHNVHNGKNEVYEDHNLVTNALADIFAGNYGGVMNYNSFSDLYANWLGGVLLFEDYLDTSAANYGIPAYTSNPITAHAGRISITEDIGGQADDLTRGNPDNSGTVLNASSTKLVWEWGTSAGIGTISSLGLTHSEVGSYGCGVVSNAQKLLNPFADVACISNNQTYGDNADAVLEINGNLAYNFYLVDSTHVDIFVTPINNTKFKLQGGSVTPLSRYTNKITAVIQNYNINGAGGCYYHFDFANNKLILFGVPTQGGTTLLKDEIDLTNGTVVSSSITVTGALLWKFTGQDSGSATGYSNTPLSVPTKAMIYDNHIFVYGNSGTGDYNKHPTKMFKINLANTADISEVDTTDAEQFDGQSGSRTNERFAMLGGIIVHDSFLINGDKVFPVARKNVPINGYHNYSNKNAISAASFGLNTSLNSISVNKLALFTKFALDNPINKSSAQAMTVEYTLTEQ